MGQAKRNDSLIDFSCGKGGDLQNGILQKLSLYWLSILINLE